MSPGHHPAIASPGLDNLPVLGHNANGFVANGFVGDSYVKKGRPMQKLKQAYGNWVVGDQFWRREEDVALMTQRVDGAANQLLVAVRRMGKTSLMHELARRLAARYTCVFLDLQKAWSGADAVVEMSLGTHEHKPLWERTLNVFGSMVEALTRTVESLNLNEVGIKLRASMTEGDWARKGDHLFHVLAAAPKPVLLLMDEVPILVNRLLKGSDYRITPERRQRTDEFMSWLRDNSQRHQGKVRMIVTGSIGLEPVLRQAGLSASLNTFALYDLKPWSEDTAVGCLRALANEYGVQYRDQAEVHMARRLGCCIPHHVQTFFQRVHDVCVRRKNMEVSSADVEPMYTSEMLGSRGHAELAHYEERLRMVLGSEILPLALEMLTEAAVTGRLTREALIALQKFYQFPERTVVDAQKEILGVLEHDGYLRPEDNGFVFVSRLVADWWKHTHATFHIPVLDRKI